MSITKENPGTETRVHGKSPRTPLKPITKKAQLITLLSRKAGCDIQTISERLGWLHHTTRAALSGLRKSGRELIVEKRGKDNPSRYRIAAVPLARPPEAAEGTDV